MLYQHWIQKPPLGVQINWARAPRGLLGFWLLNERDGNVIYDLSGNGYKGTLTNMAFPSTSTSGWNVGPDGSAIAFDASDDYILNTQIPKESLQGDFTIVVRAKADITSGISSALCGTRSSQDSGWAAKAEQWNDTGKVGFTYYGVADYTTNIATPTDWATFGFVHRTADGKVDVYVDGEHEELSIGSLNTSGMYDGLVLGASYRNEEFLNYLDGAISYACLFQRALTAEEVWVFTRRPYAMLDWPLPFSVAVAGIPMQMMHYARMRSN